METTLTRAADECNHTEQRSTHCTEDFQDCNHHCNNFTVDCEVAALVERNVQDALENMPQHSTQPRSLIQRSGIACRKHNLQYYTATMTATPHCTPLQLLMQPVHLQHNKMLMTLCCTNLALTGSFPCISKYSSHPHRYRRKWYSTIQVYTCSAGYSVMVESHTR